MDSKIVDPLVKNRHHLIIFLLIDYVGRIHGHLYILLLEKYGIYSKNQQAYLNIYDIWLKGQNGCSRH